MYKFSETSKDRLATCHPDLQRLFNEVIKRIDCTIIYGARSDYDQQKLFKEGKSKLDGVKNRSKHQTSKEQPFSLAVDAAPYPINWEDRSKFCYFAGIVLAKADSLGIKIRWGGDWNCDNDLKNQTFFDLPHFELVL